MLGVGAIAGSLDFGQAGSADCASLWFSSVWEVYECDRVLKNSLSGFWNPTM